MIWCMMVRMPSPRLLCSTGPFYMAPLTSAFDAIAKAGFDGVEVMVTTERETQDAARLRAMSETSGLAIDAIHAPFLLLTRGVFTTNPLEKIKRSTALAQEAGAPLVVVHPAYRWQTSYATWLENEVGAFSGGEQTTVAVENMFPVWVRGRGLPFHRSMGIEDMKKFPSITLDTSHAAVTGIDVMTAFDALADRIAHVHLSNNLGTGRDTHSPLANGVLPIAALLRRMAAAGFTGSITLEMDVREWIQKPADLAAVLRDQREFCLDALGAPA